jgi:hypothetical protein
MAHKEFTQADHLGQVIQTNMHKKFTTLSEDELIIIYISLVYILHNILAKFNYMKYMHFYYYYIN